MDLGNIKGVKKNLPPNQRGRIPLNLFISLGKWGNLPRTLTPQNRPQLGWAKSNAMKKSNCGRCLEK
jgi:hypothetical protein